MISSIRLASGPFLVLKICPSVGRWRWSYATLRWMKQPYLTWGPLPCSIIKPRYKRKLAELPFDFHNVFKCHLRHLIGRHRDLASRLFT